jgi:hypothetical protein
MDEDVLVTTCHCVICIVSYVLWVQEGKCRWWWVKCAQTLKGRRKMVTVKWDYLYKHARKVEGWDEHSKDWIGHFVFQKLMHILKIKVLRASKHKIELLNIKYCILKYA